MVHTVLQGTYVLHRQDTTGVSLVNVGRRTVRKLEYA